MILNGGDLPASFGYLPLELAFPFDTNISYQIMRSGRQISLISRFGKLQITITESSWSKSGFVYKTFNYIPRLRHDSDHYREVVFDVRLSFHVNKFRALWPWNSDEFEDYFEWGQAVIRNVIEQFSWDHYRQTESRDEIMRLRRQFAQFDAEARIEMLCNFPDSIEGKVAKYLRWTRSWVWENRREGLSKLIAMVGDVPAELAEDIVQRLLVMSRVEYDDTVTPWKVTEALGVYSGKVRRSLVLEIYSALVAKLDTYDQSQRKGLWWAALGKSLAQVQKRLEHDEQIHNLHRVITEFLEPPNTLHDDEISLLLWDNSTMAAQEEIKSFIEEHVHSSDEEDIYTGIQYCLALRRELEPTFLAKQLSLLLNRKLQQPKVRVGVMQLARSSTSDIAEPDRNLLLQFLLREINGNEPRTREVAALTLKEQYVLFEGCGEVTNDQIVDALLGLSDDENPDIEFMAVSALASYVTKTSPQMQVVVADTLLRKIEKHSSESANDMVSIAAREALQALVNTLPDGDLKQRIEEKEYV